MNYSRDGIRTSEFWLAVGGVLSTIAVAALGVLIAHNVLTSEQAEAWRPLILGIISLVVLVLPVAIKGIVVPYIEGRNRLKEIATESAAELDRLELLKSVDIN